MKGSPVLYIASELHARDNKEEQDMKNDFDFLVGFMWIIVQPIEAASKSAEEKEKSSE